MKGWFTARELADLNLPGIPTSKRAINRMATAQRWRKRVSFVDGQPLARKRAGVKGGGGWEYHHSVVTDGLEPQCIVVTASSFAEEERRERLLRDDKTAHLIVLSPQEMAVVSRVAKRNGVPAGLLAQHWLKQIIAMMQVAA